jgi:hypothetical protein
MGPPITFNVDGKQHIALMGNPGGGATQPPRIVVFSVKE